MARLFDALVAHADTLFLVFSYLVERVRARALAVDDVASLPTGEAIYRDFLDGLHDCFGDKDGALAEEVLLTLAAFERAHAWYLEGRDPPYAVDPAWRGVPLDTLIELLDRDADDGWVILTLQRLKPVLGSWRGDAAAHVRYRIGLKGLAEAIADHPRLGPALTLRHRALAERVIEAAGGQEAGAKADAGEAREDTEAEDAAAAIGEMPDEVLRYALAHAKLSADEDILRRFLTSAPLADQAIERTTDHLEAARYAEAIEWTTLVILWNGEFVAGAAGELPPHQTRDALASAYMSRGNALASLNRLEEALSDHGRAIALRQALRVALGEAWPPAYRDDLATTYMSRGTAFVRLNRLEAAVGDFDRAIAVLWALREAFGETCPPQFRDALAAAYTNRGVALARLNRLDEAIADHGRAIELGEALRKALGEAWPLKFCKDLASAYTNRGNALRSFNRLEDAVGDCDRAIELGEALRKALGEAWPPEFRNTLATAYMNRGNALQNLNRLEAAVGDYGRAIELRKALRAALGEAWPPAFRNDLAAAYSNRGVALVSLNRLEEAIGDHGRAIGLREALRKALGEAWPPDFRNTLATAYMNRAIALRSLNRLEEAARDDARAEELRRSGP